MGADLGAPPPERLERLYRAMLEGNDLFRDTGGATLSLDPDTGRVRLQRFDSFEALEEAGPDKAFAAFADVAAAWAELIRARFRNLSDSTGQPTAMKPRKLVDNPAGLRAINPSG